MSLFCSQFFEGTGQAVVEQLTKFFLCLTIILLISQRRKHTDYWSPLIFLIFFHQHFSDSPLNAVSQRCKQLLELLCSVILLAKSFWPITADKKHITIECFLLLKEITNILGRKNIQKVTGRCFCIEKQQE